jgi:hypothetical protein
MTSGEESPTDADLMFADMSKPNKKTARQRPLDGRCLPTESKVWLLELMDRPATVSLNEWELYKQLVCELEEAEYLVRDLRCRTQTLEQRLAGRAASQDKAFEHLNAALPITTLLQ